MTSEGNDNIQDKEKLLISAATDGRWFRVLKLYEEHKNIRLARKDTSGDTVLHMAISSGKEYVAELLLNLVCSEEKSNEEKSADENGYEKKNVLGAQNEEGNTLLHLAAFRGNVEMCKKISKEEPSLASKRNKAGETPLFMAALGGHRRAFLWLHYKHCPILSEDLDNPKKRDTLDYCIKRDNLDDWIKRNNHDTILHCALEKEHIDVAIEIVHLYKNNLKQMIMRNKNGVSPLHILAATPSTFESTHLPGRPFIVRFLHCWPCFRVKKKTQATMGKELEQDELELPCFHSIVKALLNYADRLDDSEGSSWANSIMYKIVILLCFLAVIPPFLLLKAEIPFDGIRNLNKKYTWSLQIVGELLQLASVKDITEPYEEDSEVPKIVDSPLMIAAKNGVIEMVEKILQKFPPAIYTVNEEGKNIVLLAAEKRQTKLYQTLYRNEELYKMAFEQVDKDGNTALHLAAKLDGVNLNWQTTTMVEEYKWFKFVKRSAQSSERYNNKGETAEEIFRKSYEKHIASDREWLNQTSKTCSVASTLVASMAFTNIAGENFDKQNNSSLVALSLSLTSTISFLAIVAFRSESLLFWKYAPFMLQIAILTMFGSIVALWISLMLHGKSLTTYAILGSPIAILTIISLPIFIGPTLMSIFTEVPPPNRNPTSAIHYPRPQKNENRTDVNQGNQVHALLCSNNESIITSI